MMVWSLTLLPLLAGGLLWAVGGRVPVTARPRVLGSGAVGTLVATLALAVGAVTAGEDATYAVGAGIELSAGTAPPAGAVAVLVPAVAAVVAAYAAVHEPAAGLPRLLGLLTAFAGAMLLLVTAEDLLTLLVGFELVTALSWSLIGHDWRSAATVGAAAHAFNATRAGGLGLFLAAGAAFAATGSFAYDDLETLTGGHAHVLAAGVLVAAAAKSAQGPFAPWLFSAMAGPTPVSALLHSSTMVAAGVYVLARLHTVLDQVAWFAPATVALGLATALAGGVVALLQPHVKKLLAASTSAQYGLMLVAVGVGHPAVAVLHLVVHAVFKAQLFLAAGTAIHAVGSEQLGDMRLGRQLRVPAGLAAVGSLALASVPPLGGAASKEHIVAAAGHEAVWLAALVVVAGGLSAAYATRFQVLAFGRLRDPGPSPRPPAGRASATEQGTLAVLAAASLALGALWLPSVRALAGRLLAGAGADGGALVSGGAGELVASLAVVAVGAYAVLSLERGHRLGSLGATGSAARAADWLGLPAGIRRTVVGPSLALAGGLALVDDRIVDGGVRAVAAGARWTSRVLTDRAEVGVDAVVGGVAAGARLATRACARVAERAIDGAVAAAAWVVDRGGADARRIQTGLVHHQFVVIAVGLALVALAAVTGR